MRNKGWPKESQAGAKQPGRRTRASSSWDVDCQEAASVRSAKEGSETAIEQLAHRYWPVAYRTVACMLRNQADAEEAAQEAICAAITHLPSFRGEATFRTWFHRIAINHALLCLRRKSTTRRLLTTIHGEVALPATHAPKTPEQLLIDAERWRLMEEGLGRIPGIYSTVLQLFVRDGRTAGEIAAQLNLSTGAVKTRLKRARDQLRDEISRIESSHLPAGEGLEKHRSQQLAAARLGIAA